MNKSLIWSLVLLVIVAAVYRLMPNRPYGFAPHLAMALFAGAIIKDKKWAFALPVFSIFLSDLLYELLFIYNVSDMPGFYEGQVTNYLLFIGVTCIGFLMQRVTALKVVSYSILVATVFFLTSNFLVWLNNAGFARPKTWNGLLQCYADALPFYRGSLEATLIFSAILFGGYHLLTRYYIPSKAA